MDYVYGRAARPIADDSDADQNMLSNRICIGYSLGVAVGLNISSDMSSVSVTVTVSNKNVLYL